MRPEPKLVALAGPEPPCARGQNYFGFVLPK
jgi:hypothetical protein